MTPYYADEWLSVYQGDCRAVMSEMEPESVHCVVTSPPYWGLRDYGTATWAGGDEGCDHRSPTMREGRNEDRATLGGGVMATNGAQLLLAARTGCGKCGATRQDAQLGLEPTPEEYVANLVDVFREVRRVLRSDGTVWLNLGDSYAGSGKGPSNSMSAAVWDTQPDRNGAQARAGAPTGWLSVPHGLKPKDLVGIPWRVAFALQQPYYTGTIRDERDRIWLAAMLDAEGCLFIHKRKAGQSNGQGYHRTHDNYGPGVEISNTSLAVIERIMALVGKGSVSTAESGTYGRKQTLYRWNLRTTECREFVRELYPHLVAKQQQARILIGCPSNGERAEAAHAALIALHRTGISDVDFPAPASMFEPGWYLRSDIIWAKNNPMPESVTDRPTKSHEYLFLLSKSPRYYFDADAVREENSPTSHPGVAAPKQLRDASRGDRANAIPHDPRDAAGRNIRSVWTIATQPYPGAHFATFPRKLVEPCVKAGSPEGGVVLDCFAGSGTTGLVAQSLSRRAVLIDLNADYLIQAMGRNRDIPLGLAL